MDYETLLTDIGDGVAVISLNRPERRNAYVPRMGAELNHAFWTLDQRDDVRVMVVTGCGRSFCVGADMGLGADTFETRLAQRKQAADGVEAPYVRPWKLATPIIGAINGDAVGVGLTLPLQWDIRITSETAKLSFAFVRRGTIPEANSHWILPRLVGASRAMELLITGRTFNGDEAAGIGLSIKSVAAEDVLPTALDIARDMAANVSPVAAALVKRLVYRQLSESDPDEAFKHEAELFKWLARQPDAKEGVRSFLEKRPPEWPMSTSKDLPPG